MSNIDKQALREAAEKAIAAITRLTYEPGINPDDVKTIKEFHEMSHPECVLALLDELEADKEQIKTLESRNRRLGGIIDAEEKRIAELREMNAGLAQESFTYQQRVAELDNSLCELLPGTQYMDPPDGGNVTPLEQVRRMIADYRHRIAELEARTVTLPAQKFCPGEYMDSVLWSETEVWNQAISECAKAIRAAGIGKGE